MIHQLDVRVLCLQDEYSSVEGSGYYVNYELTFSGFDNCPLPDCQQVQSFNFTAYGLSVEKLRNFLSLSPKHLMYTSIQLSYNFLDKIEDDMFENFPNLVSILMDHNTLKEVPDLTYLHHLHHLDLSSNYKLLIQKMKLPKSLKELNLSWNPTKIFKKDFFEKLIHLKTLILSNGVKEGLRGRFFEEEAFDGLYKLEKLDISHSHWLPNTTTNLRLYRDLNSLKVFRAQRCFLRSVSIFTDPQKFASLPFKESLEELDLSVNLLKDAAIITTLNFSNLISLDLSRTRIRRGLPRGAFQGMPRLQKISLKACNIKDVDLGAINQFDLVYLNLASNKLKQLPRISLKMKKLIFTGNRASNITKSNMLWMKNMESLDLSNQNIQFIEDFSFLGDQKKCPFIADSYCVNFLKFLNLSRNHLKDFDKKMFKGLTFLSVLDIGNNQIEILKSDMSEIPIEILIASSNNISIVSSKFLESLSSLVELDLSSNNLENFVYTIDFNKLRKLNLRNNQLIKLRLDESILWNLVELDISENILNNLTTNTFGSCCVGLKKITASFNSITNIENSTFQNVNSLETFIADNCNLNLETFQPFATSYQLKTLILSANLIKRFVDVCLTKLQTLHLHSNLIETIEDVPLREILPNIKVLILKNNRINYIKPGSLDQLNHLNIIDLKNNPIKCPCNDSNDKYQQGYRYLHSWLWDFSKSSQADEHMFTELMDDRRDRMEYKCMIEEDVQKSLLENNCAEMLDSMSNYEGLNEMENLLNLFSYMSKLSDVYDGGYNLSSYHIQEVGNLTNDF